MRSPSTAKLDSAIGEPPASAQIGGAADFDIPLVPSSPLSQGYTSVDVRQLSYPTYLSMRLRELWRYRHALKSAVTLNLRGRYRRSSLGFAWSLINPLLTMLVLAFVFGNIFRQTYPVFSIYVFSALRPWNFISQTISHSTEAIVSSEDSLKRVALSKAFFPLVTVLTETVNFVLALLTFMVLGLFLGAHYSPAIFAIPLATFLCGLLVFGLSLSIAILTVYIRDLTHITGVVLQLVFYTIPIIYPKEVLPDLLHKMLIYNPFYHFVKLFRLTIFESRMPDASDWAICTLMALVSVCASMYLLQRTERELLFRL